MLVTVVMPVYNCGAYVREAVESILRQSYGDFEFIVIDDGSDDDTPVVLASHVDPRMRIVRNQRNVGVTASLNHGLQEARGQWIARMDADDVSHPERLRAQLQYLVHHPDVAAVGSWAHVIDETGRCTETLAPVCDPQQVRANLAWRNCIVHGSVLVRASAMKQMGGYRAFLRAQDYDLWLRLTDQAPCVANVPEYLYDLRQHDASVTGSNRTASQAWAFLAQHASRERRRTGSDILDRLSAAEMVALADRVVLGQGRLGREWHARQRWTRALAARGAGTWGQYLSEAAAAWRCCPQFMLRQSIVDWEETLRPRRRWRRLVVRPCSQACPDP